MQVESKLAGVIANQIGRLEGILVSQIERSLFEETEQYINTCPEPNRLIRSGNKRSTLADNVNNFEKRLDRFRRVPQRLLQVVTPLNVLLNILRNLPIPTAVPPGIGIPVSVTNRYAELIYNLLQFSRSLEKDAEAITSIIDSINPSLDRVRNSFRTLDSNIRDCVETLPEDERRRVTEQLQITIRENTGNNNENNPNQEQYRNINGTDYTIKVIEKESEVGGAKLRQVVGLNNNGVVVIRGESSYSSSSKVLIDELKFRIDQLR